MPDDLLNSWHLRPHFGERIAKDFDDRGNNACEEGTFHAEGLAAVANGATEDPSEHVSTAIRTRRGAVGKRGYQAACVIGDDAIRDVDRVFQRPAIGAGAADVGDSVKDPREEIGVVVASKILL